MNYLAHAYFSNGDENLLLGNFMADHLRGNNFEHLSEEIKQGIHLHRAIDSFTDDHPAFKKSKRIFYDGYERYSGILVDIYFDHFLASNFANYAGMPLKEFTSKVYTVYQNNRHILPETGNGFLNYVIKNDIYNAYAKIDGIERVLYHLSHRIGHDFMLDGSVNIYKQNQEQLHEHFGELISDGIERFLKI